MKKRVALFLLIAVVMSSILPAYAELYGSYSPYYGTLQTTTDGFVYEILDNGEAQISGYTGSKKELVIPSRVDGHLVTSIKQYAFFQLNITKATIPGTVKTINGGAFIHCDDLRTIVLEEGIKELHGGSFHSCKNLVNINFPSSLTTILSNPFWNCESLSTIVLSNSHSRFSLMDDVLYDLIDNRLLWYPMTKNNKTFTVSGGTKVIASFAISKSSVSEIFIPEGVEILEACAIEQSSKLKIIHIPASVQKMEGSLFSNTSLENIEVNSLNTQYETMNGVLFNKIRHSLMLYPSYKSQTSYSVPDGTLIIERDAFQNVSKLLELKLPQSLREIEAEAIVNCSHLRVLRVPDNVTQIGQGFVFSCEGLEIAHLPNSAVEISDGPFKWCKNLTTIVLSDDHPTLSLIDGCLIRNRDKTLLCYPGGRTNRSYTIPRGIEIIGDYAFTGTDHLAELIIPEGVTTIRSTIFSLNGTVKKVWLPASLKNFAASNSQYQSITFVVIPGTYAENVCKNLGLNYEYTTASTSNSTTINTGNGTLVVHGSSDPDTFTANWYGYDSDDSESLEDNSIGYVELDGQKYQLGSRWSNHDNYYVVDTETNEWKDAPILGSVQSGNKAEDTNDAQTFKGSKYKVYYASDLNIHSWEEARDFCKSMGGHLAIISSAAENQFVTDLIEDTGYNRVFIGCYFDTNARTWKWVNGEKLSNGYTRWSAGEPSDPYNERYGQIGQGNGFWNDSKFLGTEYGSYVTWGSAFVCEWD